MVYFILDSLTQKFFLMYIVGIAFIQLQFIQLLGNCYFSGVAIKMAGYQRYIFRPPILLKMPFRWMKAFLKNNVVFSRNTFSRKRFFLETSHNFVTLFEILSEKFSDFWGKIFGGVAKIAFYVRVEMNIFLFSKKNFQT